VAIASVVVLGQGGVWYSRQFWALYFLQTGQEARCADVELDRRHRAADRHPDP
jgi:hypothetical protein